MLLLITQNLVLFITQKLVLLRPTPTPHQSTVALLTVTLLILPSTHCVLQRVKCLHLIHVVQMREMVKVWVEARTMHRCRAEARMMHTCTYSSNTPVRGLQDKMERLRHMVIWRHMRLSRHLRPWRHTALISRLVLHQRQSPLQLPRAVRVHQLPLAVQAACRRQRWEEAWIRWIAFSVGPLMTLLLLPPLLPSSTMPPRNKRQGQRKCRCLRHPQRLHQEEKRQQTPRSTLMLSRIHYGTRHTKRHHPMPPKSLSCKPGRSN
mmetsp:Transcript_49711/g.73011  ORF Transcript_49711/g.73011 Transcript_49711/m.73011 type:complete len:263 (-) Transcript_49711:877-1665(-)